MAVEPLIGLRDQLCVQNSARIICALNGGLDPGAALRQQFNEALARRAAEDFIGNPDLVERFRDGAPFAKADRKGFYTGEGDDNRGYTDYPNYK